MQYEGGQGHFGNYGIRVRAAKNHRSSLQFATNHRECESVSTNCRRRPFAVKLIPLQLCPYEYAAYNCLSYSLHSMGRFNAEAESTVSQQACMDHRGCIRHR